MDELAIQGNNAILNRNAELEDDSFQLKPRYKYMNDPEEMAYWTKVFGKEKIEIEPENIHLQF